MFERFRTNSNKNSKVICSAFHSLSFRRKDIYSLNIMSKSKYINSNSIGTYGGILSIRNELGEELYALVQGRYTGKWSFPKGHSYVGELPIECALREVSEETGIEELPEPIDYVKVGYGYYYIFKLKSAIELIARDVKEIMDTKWVTLEEMGEMELNADANLYRKKMIMERLNKTEKM